jgi:hypothetical protein
VKHLLTAFLLAAAFGAPIATLASTIDPALIPDGTYVVKVEKVKDPQHVLVLMQNGVETMLVARNALDFSKLKANDTVRVSLIKGIVPVFAVQ